MSKYHKSVHDIHLISFYNRLFVIFLHDNHLTCNKEGHNNGADNPRQNNVADCLTHNNDTRSTSQDNDMDSMSNNNVDDYRLSPLHSDLHRKHNSIETTNNHICL